MVEATRKRIEDHFKESFGRDINMPANQEVLNEGDSNCQHQKVFYVDNGFDGQAFWCDDCKRHERIDYSPGFIIKFPENALVSTLNPKYGGESFYAFKTDGEGVINKPLDSWIKREK